MLVIELGLCFQKARESFIVRNNDLCNDDPSENVYKFLR